ncbi:MAG TPA: hypothetical protein VLG46_17070 [Anaerolineae bacterium]|nr:hypothetical protein [Anaerolineae bacterium]
MSRTSMLISAVVLATASLIMMVGLLVNGALARAPTSLRPTSINASADFHPPAEYCYTWDFGNNTGYDATGIKLRLAGLTGISQVYTGTLNPFGELDPSSGYDAGTNSYRFNFDNGIAYDIDRVQLGLCAAQPQLRLSTLASAAVWLSGTESLALAPLFAGIEFDWLARDQVTVTIVNEQALTLTLETATALQPEAPLPLDDLTSDVALQLPFVAELITEPLTLPPLASQSFAVSLSVLNQPIVFEARLSAEDDPGNTVHLLAQTMVPGWQVFLPLVLR